MTKRAYASAKRVMRNGHDLIDHNLRRLLEAISRQRPNGGLDERGIEKLGRQEVNGDDSSAKK